MRYFALLALSICFISHSQVYAMDNEPGSGSATQECWDFRESHRNFNECVEKTVVKAKYRCSVNTCGPAGMEELFYVRNVKCSWKLVRKQANMDTYDTTCDLNCYGECRTRQY